MCWYTGDNDHMATIVQDGKIIIWNAKTQKRAYLLSQNTWLMTGDFNQCGKRFAAAGLDNIVTIHDIPDLTQEGVEPFPPADAKAPKMEKHKGYIGAVKWLDDKTIISGSGDKTIMLWDASKDAGVQKEPENTFIGHGLRGGGSGGDAGDVASLTVHSSSTDTFISGASDGIACLWDRRLSNTGNQCAMSFTSHTSAITDIKFMPSGQQFVTSSEDGTYGMFDFRSGSRIHTMSAGGEKTLGTAVCVSASGRYLMGGTGGGAIKVYDLLCAAGAKQESGAILDYHGEEITSLVLSRDGCAFGSTCRSTENNVAIWA
jgi:WD40 repeat protein